MGLAVDHGRRPDERHETRRVIGRAAGHLVALVIPGLDDHGVAQNPFTRFLDQLIGGHHLIDHAGGLGLFRVVQLAFKQERRGRHRAQLAHKTCCAARTGENPNHDLGQADFGRGVVGGKDAVTSQRNFKANAKRRARQSGGNRLATLVGLGVHARALDLSQDGMHPHHPVKEPLGGIVARVIAHLGDDVEVHTSREGPLFARGDDHALDGLIRQGLVNQRLKVKKPLAVHNIHRLANGVPCDDGHAVAVGFHREISHVLLSDLVSRQRAAIFAGKGVTGRIHRHLHVEIAVISGLCFGSCAHHQKNGGHFGLVHKVMAIGLARWESGTIAGLQRMLALIVNQGAGSFRHHHELVLRHMVMAQGRHRAGVKPHEINAILAEPACIAQGLAAAPGHGRGQLAGIA